MPPTFLAKWKHRLFPNFFEGVLSAITTALVVAVLYAFLKWVFITANWAVITESMRFLMAGSMPIASIGRAWVAATLFSFMTGLSLGGLTRAKNLKPVAAAVAALILIATIFWAMGRYSEALTAALFIAAGCGWLIMQRVASGSALLGIGWIITTIIMWNVLIPDDGKAAGGLLLGILMTLVAAVFSFPLGVLLALGRTNRLPGIRITCVAYIELIRSLPLISILYWAWMVVPLILPADFRINDLVRGAAGFTLFYAAYVAEYVRGGLQGVPEGQLNAARSLGLNSFAATYYIILPQALRSVLPGLVGNVLDIFNNVPLLFIIGLTEFVRAGQVLLSNPQHSAQMYEVYTFMFMVYLVIATLLSWSSRVVENKLSHV
ncbi:amino acid ABC transporter permease [Paralcaligenes ureilyticus]|uniref:General L-amino acid transport system permease protein n=1 Tax=Paralcaligenes ureilyticus TaxID=627131 RepID=A0A4R3M8P8_9BURK|nr:amino acid ABC transporter permease [Paralcaligenes ureilyticus]TCT08669.1 general L-amino acid transport system permease protein [Paralcaligenes ureilyticus]